MKKINISVIILFLGISMAMPTAFGYVELYDLNYYVYDIDEYRGLLYNGHIDAYDSMYYLIINGTDYYSSSGAYTTELGGRQIVLPVINIDGLNVQRKIFVPLTENWARYLEIIHNPSASPKTVDIRIYGNLGSDTGTYLISTSSTNYSPPLYVDKGDTILNPLDFWAVTDDYSEDGEDPPLAHVWDGSEGKDHIDYLRLNDHEFLEYLWNGVIIAPGQTVVIMHFAVQQTNRANAISTAKKLYDNTGNFNHIMYSSESGNNDIQNIVNWGTGYQNKEYQNQKHQNKELPMESILGIIQKDQED